MNRRNADLAAHPVALGVPAMDEGLTKREYFAGQALAGLVARGLHDNPDCAAKKAIRLADALLEYLDRPRLADLVEEADSLVPPPF